MAENKPNNKPNTVRLNTASKVNKFIANTINRLNRGEIPESKAKAIFYGCTVLLSGLEKGEIEKKVEELEQIINNRGY